MIIDVPVGETQMNDRRSPRTDPTEQWMDDIENKPPKCGENNDNLVQRYEMEAKDITDIKVVSLFQSHPQSQQTYY